MGRGWRFLLLPATGCVAAAMLPVLPGWGGLLLILVLSLAGLGFRISRAPALFLLGMAWFLGHAQWLTDRQWPEDRAGDRQRVTGTVAGLPVQHEQSLRFEIRTDRGANNANVPRRIQVSWFRPPVHVQPGSRWNLELELRPPAGRDNPFGFDSRRDLLSKRIGATAAVRDDFEALPDSPRGLADRQRQRLASILQAETEHRDAAALKRALGLADRSAMQADTSDLLRRTGTAHLLAISGLHVGMVAGMVTLLCSLILAPLVLLGGRLDRRRIALAGGLLAAMGYAMLAGFTLPTQRALIMLAAVVLAFFFRRGIAPAHALLLALAAVLLFDPMAPLATGFWLSFAAVGVLVWAFAWRPVEPAARSQWLVGLMRAQLVVAVGLLPLNIGVFQQLVPGAFLANLGAIPLVGIWILPALLMEMVGVALGLGTAWVSRIGETGLMMLIHGLQWIDQLRWSHMPWVAGSQTAVLLAAIGALWLLAPRGWPARGLGVILLLPLLAARPGVPGKAELEMWMLDTGDGLAVLMHNEAEVLLYDTGPGDGQGNDLIGRELDSMLAGLNHRRIDRVVVSHDHRAHAGGLGSIQDRVPPERILGSPEHFDNPCLAGQAWQAGKYRFRILHPSSGLPDLGANSSCVLHVAGPGGSMLLTGAIDAAVEARLVQLFNGPPADVLVLSAGGHRRGSSSSFLAAVSPGLALASVRRHDRFERPHPEVRQRLDAAGVRLVSTGQCGALRVRMSEGRAPEIRSMATLKPRFWKQRDHCP
ncbi:DNA internalization-related competence protein ComEC/Rec2 [Wenzhouxiangella sp. AB-CW3]|uniref:DNA internalization-related competence protein ComEC/Rec2 n=1 Tax=Wenzhouxiangella sp. AB-CW3 TaxID=2771012 RepID=UPI00168AEF45|nr:DNA internalization-related competence protein ComEC/Rec2 [Wenzhouxiangella sp. AB-CW3]QOC21111.1 DNA internalization-related competence protein ComEC/Rec2 [Wenzhouxiangella sp. AB-CW3]